MTSRIEPALSAEEWAKQSKAVGPVSGSSVSLHHSENAVHFVLWSHDTWRGEPYTAAVLASPATMRAAIALANAALPDSDPRKIAREWDKALRDEAERGEYAERTGDNAGFSAIDPALARQMADALESYLPPEGT